jgi:NADPH-dependent 2,4-dienoyl-CoA reductase/sulfur reductase-like enzyme
MERRDVIIIGGGPAGLSAARRLHDLGIKNVLVIEREAEAGGIPRHCGHAGFGWDSHWRMWNGPRFAAELRNAASQVEIRTRTTVLELAPEGRIRVQTHMGVREMQARQILLATGTRETPRSSRLVGGSRPLQGVMNTGALQQHVYFYGNKPFERPVIIGSEWVSYSALLTCRHLGIRPVAMLEEKPSTDAPALGRLIARLAFGVPVRLSARLVAIEGKDKVEAVEVEVAGRASRISCDGVIFTGRFQPELALVPKGSFLEGLDNNGRDRFLAAGNVLSPLKTSGKCWLEGRKAAEIMKTRLA